MPAMWYVSPSARCWWCAIRSEERCGAPFFDVGVFFAASRSGAKRSVPTSSQHGHAATLQRNCKQRIDLAAVQDHHLFGETRAIGPIEDDAIFIAAGGEEHRLAGAHHPRHNEAGPRPHTAGFDSGDQWRAEHMTVTLALIDIGLA